MLPLISRRRPKLKARAARVCLTLLDPTYILCAWDPRGGPFCPFITKFRQDWALVHEREWWCNVFKLWGCWMRGFTLSQILNIYKHGQLNDDKDSEEFQKTQENFKVLQRFQRIQKEFRKFQRNAKDSKGFQRISENSKGFQRTTKDYNFRSIYEDSKGI